MSIAYLNGSFRPLEETCISVMDRGFLFGDGIYEVIPVYGGRLFRLSRHLKRLQRVGTVSGDATESAWAAMSVR